MILYCFRGCITTVVVHVHVHVADFPSVHVYIVILHTSNVVHVEEYVQNDWHGMHVHSIQINKIYNTGSTSSALPWCTE